MFVRHKPKEQLTSKIRKKVSFNLNVQTYEPISTSYHFLKDEEDEKVEKRREEIEEGSLSTSLSGSGSSNLNYRYQNCRDFYDEEDDIAFEDSDLDDYDLDDIDDNGDGDSGIGSQRESKDGFSELLDSSSMSSDKKDEPVEEKANISSGTNKTDFTHSVLKPVENLTQWRAAKAKTATSKHERKENNLMSRDSLPPFGVPMPSSEPVILKERQQHNQAKPLLQEITVDASLSTWISSRNS